MHLLLRLWILAILLVHVRGATSVVGPYTLTSTSSAGTFTSASTTCAASHSWLVETKNAEINTAADQLAGSQQIWIGLQYDTVSSTWKWNDLEEMSYENWNRGEPNSDSEQCAMAGEGGNWYDVGCNTGRNVVCQSVTNPKLTSGVNLLTRSDNSLNRDGAEQACANAGRWLVRIKDEQLNIAVFDLIRTYGGSYWIGLKHDIGSGTVSWSDDDALQDGEYNKLTSTKPGSNNENCVVISPNNGEWTWEQCSSTHGYICQSNPCSSISCQGSDVCQATTTDPYYRCNPCDPDPCGANEVCTLNGTSHTCTNHCNSNPCQNGGTCTASKTTTPYYTCSCIRAYEGDRCQDPKFFTSGTCKYHLNSEKASLANVNATCLDLGGVLAMIRDEEAQNFITNSFKSLYTNRKIDYGLWIGGRKDNTTGTWKWSDDTPIPMRGNPGFSAWADGSGNGAPRPSGSGDCLILTTWPNKTGTNKWTGFNWGDISCTTIAGVACEIPVEDPCSLFECVHGSCTSLGCQWKCSCDAGYRGKLCAEDMIYIEAERAMFAIKGQNASVRLNITSFDSAPTYVKGYKNSVEFDNPFRTMSVTANGTLTFLIGPADESSRGVYTFVAGTDAYHRNTTVEIIVIGPPTFLSAKALNCSAYGQIKVEWKPDALTTTANHSITATALDSGNTTSVNVTPGSGPQSHTFSNLAPLTSYNVQVQVCPDGCREDLFLSQNVTTGLGLPEIILTASVQQEGTVCNISWIMDTSPADSTYFVVNTVSSLVYEPMYWNGSTNSTNITVTQPSFMLETRPNRNYTIYVETHNCAGVRRKLVENGTCVSGRAPPEVILSIVVDNTFSGKERKITLTLPDESNGPISCIFVLVIVEGTAATNQNITMGDLQQAELTNETGSPQTGTQYIAAALPRSDFTETSLEVVLGDDLTTSCNPYGSEEGRKRKKRALNEPIKGRSLPLVVESSYSLFTVTTIPTEDGVLLKQSKMVTFKNGESEASLVWIIGLVIGIFLLIVCIMFVLYMIKKKKQLSENKYEASEMIGRRNTEPLYANLELEPRTNTDIPIQRLQSVYDILLADGKAKIREQFERLKAEAKALDLSTEVAAQVAMKKKNRYKNILPYDNSRVCLEGEGEKGYINACYVNGDKQNKKFIASQGPLPNTVEDFWRMVVEQNCKVIVMLTNTVEKGKTKCEMYWPGIRESKQVGDITVLSLEENISGDFIKRVFLVSTEGQDKRNVTQYHFSKWPDHGVPATTSSFFRFHKAVVMNHARGDPPIIVHCSAGAGRTGTFIGFDILLAECERLKHVDVFGCVFDMRKQRVDMVQTCDQYEMLHRLLLESYLFEETDMDVAEVEERIKEDEASGSEGRSKIKAEFEDLEVVAGLNLGVGEDGRNSQFKVVVVHQEGDSVKLSIKASHVQAFDDNIKLIAAQTPKASTNEYFWRTALDNDVHVIVMLCDERTKKHAGQYWPAVIGQKMVIGCVTVELLDETSNGAVKERRLVVTRADQGKKITHFQYNEWSSTSAPDDASAVLNLVADMQTMIRAEKGAAAIVHCSDGLGRTGAFCGIVNLIDRLKTGNRVDVFRTIKDLRDCRSGMVQNIDQYRFCYSAIQAYIKSSVDIYSSVAPDDQPATLYENMRF